MGWVVMGGSVNAVTCGTRACSVIAHCQLAAAAKHGGADAGRPSQWVAHQFAAPRGLAGECRMRGHVALIIFFTIYPSTIIS